MLDPKIIELADTMIQLQFHERTKQLEHDILLVQNDAAMRGMGTSSPMVEVVYDLCARDVELRALIVWQNLMRVLSHAGTVPSATLADELKQAVSSYTKGIYVEPDERLHIVARNAGFEPWQSLMDARERAFTKVYAEIDLFVLGLTRRGESQSTSTGAVFNFYSPVGAVQTGPSANANVSQSINPQDREALVHALDIIKQGLDGVDRLPAHPKEEVIELVAEAQIEAGKPRPNGTKLQSISMGIATAIQTTDNRQPSARVPNIESGPYAVGYIPTVKLDGRYSYLPQDHYPSGG